MLAPNRLNVARQNTFHGKKPNTTTFPALQEQPDHPAGPSRQSPPSHAINLLHLQGLFAAAAPTASLILPRRRARPVLAPAAAGPSFIAAGIVIGIGAAIEVGGPCSTTFLPLPLRAKKFFLSRSDAELGRRSANGAVLVRPGREGRLRSRLLCGRGGYEDEGSVWLWLAWLVPGRRGSMGGMVLM